MTFSERAVEAAATELESALHEHADTPEGSRNIARRVLTAALAVDGLALVPREPSRGLLISMAVRMDHTFCAPVQEMGPMKLGHTDSYREVVLGDLRKAYEEIVGDGFYAPEREENYRRMLTAASGGEVG